MFISTLFAIALMSCSETEKTSAVTDSGSLCSNNVDQDADGLDECTESELGTSDQEADTDGDGDSDAQEIECLSDPTNPDEACYQCGWKRSDPGNITASGTEEGDIILNIPFVDQCGESIPLYDFADGYNVLFMTTQWCGACAQEVEELEDKADRFLELYGFEVRYLIGVFQDNNASVPGPEVAEQYADGTEMTRFPVLADVDGLLIDNTPYEGLQLPGKCALSPEMEILGCATGSAAEEFIFSVIVEHQANQ